MLGFKGMLHPHPALHIFLILYWIDIKPEEEPEVQRWDGKLPGLLLDPQPFMIQHSLAP